MRIRPIYTVGFFMPVQIGGAKAWKVRQHGDIGVSFQWVNEEPAMILFPARRSLPCAGAYVIALSAAFKYADSRTGGPTQYLVQASFLAAQQLGFAKTDTFAARKIAEVIVDSLPDLVEMPPEPQQFNQEQARAIGEMAIKIDGQTVHESEVTAPTEAELAAA